LAHIADGVLSVPVLVGGGVIAAGGLAISLRQLTEDTIPRTAILSAAFFTSSLLVIPVGPSSVHLLLSGLMGLVLGTPTIPAVAVALVLQALLFGFGGLTSLGVNIVNIALPGVLFGALFAPFLRTAGPAQAGMLAGVCAALSVLLTGIGVGVALALSSSEFVPSAKIILVTYIPLMIGEALITGFAVAFLKRVKPELLQLRGAAA
jgi:cobalt/nickel transport system permease protein